MPLALVRYISALCSSLFSLLAASPYCFSESASALCCKPLLPTRKACTSLQHGLACSLLPSRCIRCIHISSLSYCLLQNASIAYGFTVLQIFSLHKRMLPTSMTPCVLPTHCSVQLHSLYTDRQVQRALWAVASASFQSHANSHMCTQTQF